MKNLVLLLFISLTLALCAAAQTSTAHSGTSPAASAEKPKKVIFRPTKDQITRAQSMLKQKGLYSGDATGNLDKDTRSSIKSWQKDNGLKRTGTLNRATLEKMGIELTERQKLIPVSDSSFATSEKAPKSTKIETKSAAATTTEMSSDAKPKRTIFRATKDQINAAQKTLKDGGMYSGEQTGKLDDATRAGLKKYQEGNGLKVTGTLNQATLEKMGIELNEKQKADPQEDNDN